VRHRIEKKKFKNKPKREELHFMNTQKVSYFTLEGTYEEIGKQLARRTNKDEMMQKAPDFFSEDVWEEAIELYTTYCPGLLEELQGYADELKVNKKDLAYMWMTYLLPHCSGLVINGELLEDKSSKIFRNYEFSIEDEDFTVCHTKPKGKYAHIGGGIAVFGRTEGINECGLAVSMSSCGFPVSNLEGMRMPQIKGLQFWAVIRSILENCKDVKEALEYILRIPIAFNINLYIADEQGNGALIETMDGKVAVEEISNRSLKKYLCGTNHIVIKEFQKQEPYAMKNSVVRLENLQAFVEGKKVLEEEKMKDFFLKEYPEGMSAHYYTDWFGTVKTVLLDTKKRSYEICWLGEKENGWEKYLVDEKYTDTENEKKYKIKKADMELFQQVSL